MTIYYMSRKLCPIFYIYYIKWATTYWTHSNIKTMLWVHLRELADGGQLLLFPQDGGQGFQRDAALPYVHIGVVLCRITPQIPYQVFCVIIIKLLNEI